MGSIGRSGVVVRFGMYRVGFRGRGLSPRPSRRVSDRPLSAAPRFRNVAWCGCCAGETVQRSAEAHPLHRLPNLWAGSEHLCRPHAALGLPPMIPRGSRTHRCGRCGSSRRSSGPRPRFTQRAQRSCHVSCGPPPHRKLVDPLLSLRGNSGEASCRPSLEVPPRWRSPCAHCRAG